MSRPNLVAVAALVALLSACIHHPPETTVIERPEGPVAEGVSADTSATYLVVDRYYVESGGWWDDVEADTTECDLSRERCTERYDGKIERTVLTIRPAEQREGEVSSYRWYAAPEDEANQEDRGTGESYLPSDRPDYPLPSYGTFVTPDGRSGTVVVGSPTPDFTTITLPDGTTKTVWTPRPVAGEQDRYGTFRTDEGLGTVETVGGVTTVWLPPDWTPRPLYEPDRDPWK